MRRMARPTLCLLLAACTWVDDEADRERRDNDGDGMPMTADCNDEDASITSLPAADDVIGCGEVVTATVLGADALSTSTCLHPLRDGEELAQYGSQEDLWSLSLARDQRATVRLVPGAGFTQADEAPGGGPIDLDLAGIVLWAWPNGYCARDGCTLGLPLTGPSGAIDREVTLSLDGADADAFVLVVSASRGSGYELSVSCTP